MGVEGGSSRSTAAIRSASCRHTVPQRWHRQEVAAWVTAMTTAFDDQHLGHGGQDRSMQIHLVRLFLLFRIASELGLQFSYP
jgi:hypothetical protein